jgi:hypothetical protein
MKPYRPSNGTEGENFTTKFCEKCCNSGIDPEDAEGFITCRIHYKTLCFDADDTRYPKQWVEEDDGKNPQCLQFDIPIVPEDKETPSLFVVEK